MSDIQRAAIEEILAEIPVETSEGASDWGNTFPLAMEGATVLVLGCGAGRDAFVAGKLTGDNGRVIGVDYDEDLLKKAAEFKKQLQANNVEFMPTSDVTTGSLKIPTGSIDLVISNGAISKAPNVNNLLQGIWRVLKFGGEFYLSDIFVDRRTPEDLKTPEMVELGLDNALYIEDYRRMCNAARFLNVRSMYTAIYKKDQPEAVQDWTYFVRTLRTYKLNGLLEDGCEQYFQTVAYRGGIPGADEYFDLDDRHRFVKGEPVAVCGNTCAMVENTRLGKYFKVEGDRSVHGGPFPGCGNIPYSAEEEWV